MNPKTLNALGNAAVALAFVVVAGLFLHSEAHAAEGSGTVTTSSGTVTHPTIFPGSGTATVGFRPGLRAVGDP